MAREWEAVEEEVRAPEAEAEEEEEAGKELKWFDVDDIFLLAGAAAVVPSVNLPHKKKEGVNFFFFFFCVFFFLYFFFTIFVLSKEIVSGSICSRAIGSSNC